MAAEPASVDPGDRPARRAYDEPPPTPRPIVLMLRHAAPTLALSLLFACSGDSPTSSSVGASGESVRAVDSSTPMAAAQSIVDALRSERISDVMRLAMPKDKLAEMKGDWNETRKKPVSEAEDAQFREFMGMLLADGAEDTLYAMVAPHLEEAEKQLAGMAAMFPMMAAGMVQEAGAPEESLAMLDTFGQKIGKLEITSEKKAREAIRAIIATAEALELETSADVQALTFDEVMGKIDVVYGGLTDVLAIYGLSFDDTLKSIRFEEVSVDGDHASLSMSLELFGSERQSIPIEMQRVDGRWMPEPDESDDVGTSAEGYAR